MRAEDESGGRRLPVITHYSALITELNAAFLRGPAAVVRQRGDVFNGFNGQAGGLQGGNRGLPARAGALDPHFNLFQAELRGPLGGSLRGSLGGERRTLAAAL